MFFPLPLGINISLLLHLLVGMLGMFFFLKQLNLTDISAVFGSIAFALSNKIYAHLGAGHLSLIYAICWTPWFLYSLKNIEMKRFFSKFIPSGLIFGTMLLADLRWSIPLILIWLTYYFQSPQKLLPKIKSFFSVLGIGLMSSAAVWLPLLQLLQFTNRVNMSTSDRMVYSFSLKDLLNLLFPVFEGSAETRVYPGIVIILLVVAGLPLIRKIKSLRYWYFLIVASFLLSLGDNLPGINLIYNLPGFSLTRVPARFLFPLLFSTTIISAVVLDQLVDQNEKIDSKKIIFYLSPLIFFVFIFSIGGMILTKSFSINLIWPLFILLLIFVCIIIFLMFNNQRKWLVYLVTIALLIDLSFVNGMSLTFKDSNEILNDKFQLISELQNDNSFYRIYTPSYSISQEQGAYWGIKQINGIDPIQLDAYVKFFQLASGVQSDEYSVTLPKFKSGNPDIDNKGYCPSIPLLEELNTKYIVSSFSLKNCDFEKEKILSNQYIYTINGEGNYAKFLDCDNNKYPTLIEKKSPNEIILRVNSCGGMLQISEINFPGWRLFIDGEKADYESGYLLRQVQIPTGEHTLRMVYQPQLVIYSVISQFIFWVVSLVWMMVLKKKENDQILA
ncbi:MAG TPA: hypothetical protein VK856_07415 [Anaerolineaceae bacterium]|nr:hypothetical protein [Anaerolineaceae bacterium]